MGPHFMSLLSINVLYYNVTYMYIMSCGNKIVSIVCFKIVSKLWIFVTTRLRAKFTNLLETWSSLYKIHIPL